MGKLYNILENKIPDWRYNYKKLFDQKGNVVIGDVTIGKALSGMRGIKGLACDTSYVTADEGLHIRGSHILDLVHILPEEVLHLLLTGDIPNKAMLADLQSDLKSRNKVGSLIVPTMFYKFNY